MVSEIGSLGFAGAWLTATSPTAAEAPAGADAVTGVGAARGAAAEHGVGHCGHEHDAEHDQERQQALAEQVLLQRGEEVGHGAHRGAPITAGVAGLDEAEPEVVCAPVGDARRRAAGRPALAGSTYAVAVIVPVSSSLDFSEPERRLGRQLHALDREQAAADLQARRHSCAG